MAKRGLEPRSSESQFHALNHYTTLALNWPPVEKILLDLEYLLLSCGHCSSFSVVCEFDQQTVHPFFHVIYEKIKQDWPQDRALGDPLVTGCHPDDSLLMVIFCFRYDEFQFPSTQPGMANALDDESCSLKHLGGTSLSRFPKVNRPAKMTRCCSFLLFIMALALACVHGEDFSRSTSSSNIHKRMKREWIWNNMHIDENLNKSLPHIFGKIKSTIKNPNAMYVIKGEGAGTVFRVDDRTGDVSATERLDREKKAEYELTALILDRTNQNHLEEPSKFRVVVQDVNDNAPIFEQRVFNGSVAEMSPVGTSVTTVTAVDADDPTLTGHADIFYKVIQGEKYFSIDKYGKISTAVPNLDREQNATYVIVIEAMDGQGLRSEDLGTARVCIRLIDINDNFPTFKRNTSYFEVPENVRINGEVGRLEVEDIDEPENRDTKYSFVRGSYHDTFKIEPNRYTNEGIIRLKKPLDFEKISSYQFIVEATDATIHHAHSKKKGPKSLAKVNIKVLDIDEPPVFHQSSYTFRVQEESDIKKTIGCVSATDPDKAKREIRLVIKSSEPSHFPDHCLWPFGDKIVAYHDLADPLGIHNPSNNIIAPIIFMRMCECRQTHAAATSMAASSTSQRGHTRPRRAPPAGPGDGVRAVHDRAGHGGALRSQSRGNGQEGTAPQAGNTDPRCKKRFRPPPASRRSRASECRQTHAAATSTAASSTGQRGHTRCWRAPPAGPGDRARAVRDGVGLGGALRSQSRGNGQEGTAPQAGNTDPRCKKRFRPPPASRRSRASECRQMHAAATLTAASSTGQRGRTRRRRAPPPSLGDRARAVHDRAGHGGALRSQSRGNGRGRRPKGRRPKGGDQRGRRRLGYRSGGREGGWAGHGLLLK
ncbi:Cadherin-5 [Varanus komodoensis]|nr:Cadherin-5 [Varanus komodoensis]